jgi:hypothetical protein
MMLRVVGGRATGVSLTRGDCDRKLSVFYYFVVISENHFFTTAALLIRMDSQYIILRHKYDVQPDVKPNP